MPATTRSRARTPSAATRRHRLHADPLDEIETVDPKAFTIATVPARFAELGDLHATIDDSAYSLSTLIEWAERDEREGAEEPPPPEE